MKPFEVWSNYLELCLLRLCPCHLKMFAPEDWWMRILLAIHHDDCFSEHSSARVEFHVGRAGLSQSGFIAVQGSGVLLQLQQVSTSNEKHRLVLFGSSDREQKLRLEFRTGPSLVESFA